MFFNQNFDFSILFVCDDSRLKDDIKKILIESYEKVYCVDSDTKAMEIYNDNKIDLVIKYIKKYQDGDLNLFKEIRVLNFDLPLFTIYSMPKIELFEKSIELNIERNFPIPINEDALIRVMHKLCNEKVTERMLLDQINMLDDYRTAIDQSFLVSKTDIDGVIIDVNDNFCEISGYSRSELIDQPHSMVRHPDTSSEVLKELWDTILDKKVWKGRIKNLTKDGGFYIVEAVITPILDSNGDIKEFIAIRQDVTALVSAGRKIIEQEKEKKEIEKEHYKVLNKTKDDFLVVFTHELKTPLNAIINMSESAARRIQKIDSPRSESLRKMMSVIRDNGVDMLDTITTILDLSRLKADKLEFKNEKFTLKSTLDDLINKFNPLIHESGTKIDIDYSNLEYQLNLDRMRVNQIISNILSNAIKYSHQKIFINAKIIEDRLSLIIEDNGPGIQNKEKIFELYEQEDDGAIKRTSKGTGVGLNFVKLLCEGMDIGLSLEDSQNLGGAKFEFNFPLEITENKKVKEVA